MFKLILIFFIFITISCSQNDDVSNNLNENLYNDNTSNDKELFEKANSPKHSYFTSEDDHMMEFNSNLLKEIKDFIKKCMGFC